MTCKLLILADLLNIEPITPTPLKRPYREADDYKIKVGKTYRQVQRYSNRQTAQKKLLVYTFFLGELLEKDGVTAVQRSQARQILSQYYDAVIAGLPLPNLRNRKIAVLRILES